MTNWIVAFATPIFLAKSSYGPYFLFGSFALITALVLFVIQPETRGVSLEAVEAVFQRPMRNWSYYLKRLFGFRQTSPTPSSDDSQASLELSVLTTGSHPVEYHETGA